MYDSHEKQARKKNVLAALTYPLQGLLQPAHTGAPHLLTFQTLTLSLDSAQVQHRPHKRKAHTKESPPESSGQLSCSAGIPF